MSVSQYLRLSSIAGALLVGFWIPLRLIGFIPAMPLEMFFDLLITLISGINIYLYFTDTGLNYRQLKSWFKLGLVLDLICLMPLSFFAFLFFDQTFEAMLFFNILTARHIRQVKPFLDYFDSLQPITYRLTPVLIGLPLLVHLIACGWIALGSGTAGIDADPLLTYVKSIYWTFTTLTTVGYGDISAKTIPQMLFTCGIQVIGVGVFGYILSNVAGILARSDAAREHHMDNLDKIETFMNLHKIPIELKGKVRSYYHYMWRNKKGYHDETLIADLPNKIQSDLFFHINKGFIEKVPFFKGASAELIGDLMNKLEPRIFVPGERIFEVDDPGEALYFIHNGHIDIVGRDNQLVAALKEGSFFGEMALISDKPRTATARARTFCDIYALSKHSFHEVIARHPHLKQHIEEVMLKRIA